MGEEIRKFYKVPVVCEHTEKPSEIDRLIDEDAPDNVSLVAVDRYVDFSSIFDFYVLKKNDSTNDYGKDVVVVATTQGVRWIDAPLEFVIEKIRECGALVC